MPQGPEFRVNTYTTNYQRQSSMAFDSGGNLIVVWESDLQDGSFQGIFGQRYLGNGTPMGPEFRANAFTTTGQLSPSVTADAAGNFVVAWHSFHDGHYSGIFAQRFASTGAPLGEFQANTTTFGRQQFASVASATSGFVVAWSSFPTDGSGYGIFAQRYASTGAPLGPEFRVNTYTTGEQKFQSVASDPAGNFVVVWQSFQAGVGYDVFAQRYASTGAPLGSEFRVNTVTAGSQRQPAVASDSAGNFVVVWPSTNIGVFAQRYSNTGAPLGGEFRVNTFTVSGLPYSSVASDSAGNFVVAWQNVTDGSVYGIFAQRYLSTGAPLGGEFRVNTYTTNNQIDPSVASDPAGNFVVAWTSNLQDGSITGVFAQRYGPILPVELQAFMVE